MDETFGRARLTAQLRSEGVSRGVTRASGWTHPYHGVARIRGDDVLDPWLRISDAVPLLRSGCLLGGWASAHAQGVRYLDGRRGDTALPVVVHAPHDRRIRGREGLRVVRRRVHGDEQIEFDGVAMTTLPRALYDIALDARSLTDAVVALDMGLSTTTGDAHTTPANLAKVFSSHHKTRGLVMARQAKDLAVTRSASPLESRTRCVCTVDAGIDGWLVNVPIFDLGGRLLGIADLLNEEVGLVVETDGDGHRELIRHTDDNIREEGFERAGLVVSRLTSYDHVRKPATVTRLRAAYEQARRSPKGAWTLEKPLWWFDWPPARRWD